MTQDKHRRHTTDEDDSRFITRFTTIRPCGSRRHPIPLITLAGRWLEDANFFINRQVRISSCQNMIILTVPDPFPYP